jgi:hypothetical protein
MCRNGNSLFASIAHCIYGDFEQGLLVRQEIVKYLRSKKHSKTLNNWVNTHLELLNEKFENWN